jgi:hypothetical protein
VNAASLTAVETQAEDQLTDAIAAPGPLALNLYLTVPVNGALPLLEPVRLPLDAFNLFTGANLNNPVATAVEPALTTLVNLGYTDVVRTEVDGVPVYDRTLDKADVITPFGTLPSNIAWERVPFDLLVQLAAGIEQAADDGLVGSTPVVNPLGTIANVLGLNLPGATSTTTGITEVSGLSDSAVGAVADATNPTAPQSRNAAPSNTNSATTVIGSNPTPGRNGSITTRSGQPVKALTSGAEAAAKRAQARTDAAFKQASRQLNDIAKEGQDQIRKVVKDVQDGVKKTVSTATGADKTAKKPDNDSADD